MFGSNGQDGFYLGKRLAGSGIRVVRISRRNSEVIGDVADAMFTAEQISIHQPDYIFHFAANSTTRHEALYDNHAAISTGSLNILESTRLYCPSAKIFLSGSALQFRNEGLPINEQTPFEAGSAYSVARIQSVYAARYYRKAFGTQVYVGYFFNHDSPLRSEQHVNQKIARAAKRISQGSKEKLVLGNINVRKEFNFAGDMMEAVWLFMKQDAVHELVIGSGKAYPIADWVSCCFEKLNLDWKESVILQDDFIPEYQVLVSDPKLLMSLGWQPRVDLSQLANLMINE